MLVLTKKEEKIQKTKKKKVIYAKKTSMTCLLKMNVRVGFVVSHCSSRYRGLCVVSVM